MRLFRKRSNLLNIRHSIPGRVRFKIRSKSFDENTAKAVAASCSRMEGVMWARSNYRCNSLVIRYHADATAPSVLAGAIREFLFPGKGAATGPHLPKSMETDGPAHPVRSAMVRFGGTSALVFGVFVRNVVLANPLSQAFFSPLGILAAIAAIPLVIKGLRQLKERRFTLESFLGGAVIAAVGAGEAVAALEILWVTSGADLLTTWVTERSRRAIRDILDVTAKNTYVHVDGVEVEIPVDQVNPGDIVVVHTGEKISVDGRITDGGALVDEAPINGRAEFMSRTRGERVYAGTYVRQGVIYVRAERVGDDTYLSRILKMVEESLENKAPIEGAAEELARRLIRIGFVATTGTFLVTQSLWRTFSVMLVMACPCATALAASTAVSAALSAAAKRNILIKGGRYLEEAGKADVVCFDKTGTLTTKQPEIRGIHHAIGVDANELIQLACSAEKHNFHPIALAIKAEAGRRGLPPIPHDVCDYIPGAGIRAEIQGSEVLVGNARLMGRYDVTRMNMSHQVLDRFKTFEDRGLTVVFIAKDRQLSGIIGFANKTRPEAETVIKHMRDSGVRDISLITGDEKRSALDLAEAFDFTECHYSVMPEDKADIVKGIRNGGRKVMMVGDGINDALALAEADIGIAMGAGGSEVAIEAADIALVNDDLNGLVYVRSLSRDTMTIIRQNFMLATGTNIAGVVLGAMGLLSPVAAGLFHVIHTVGILANSGRLLLHSVPVESNAGVVDSHGKDEPQTVQVNEDPKKKRRSYERTG